MFVRARLVRRWKLAQETASKAQQTASKNEEVNEIAKEAAEPVHRGFREAIRKAEKGCAETITQEPDAYADTVLASANVPMHGCKIASSSWGNENPISALPWITTRRLKRDRFDALHALRQRPFYMPTLAQMSGQSKGGATTASSSSSLPNRDRDVDRLIQENVKKNKERTEMLWKVSASHGVSWDDLDRFYIEFHKNATRAKRLAQEDGERWNEMQNELQTFKTERMELMKRQIHDRIDRGIQDWNVYTFEKDGVRDKQEIALAVTHRINKMVRNEYSDLLRKYKRLYGFGQLTNQMRDFVLHRMALREAHERSRGLESDADAARILSRAQQRV